MKKALRDTGRLFSCLLLFTTVLLMCKKTMQLALLTYTKLDGSIRKIKKTGQVILLQKVELKRKAGANPARSRHCERESLLHHHATGRYRPGRRRGGNDLEPGDLLVLSLMGVPTTDGMFAPGYRKWSQV